MRALGPIIAASAVAMAAAGVAGSPAVAASTAHAAPAGHWCREGDPPLYASARTSCPLAGHIITDYVNVCRESAACAMPVDLAAAQKSYRITCTRTGPRYTGLVRCEAPGDSSIWTRFSSDI